MTISNDYYSTGAFSSIAQSGGAAGAPGGSGNRWVRLLFNASLSNSIYGASDTVQPPACCLIAQIKY